MVQPNLSGFLGSRFVGITLGPIYIFNTAVCLYVRTLALRWAVEWEKVYDSQYVWSAARDKTASLVRPGLWLHWYVNGCSRGKSRRFIDASVNIFVRLLGAGRAFAGCWNANSHATSTTYDRNRSRYSSSMIVRCAKFVYVRTNRIQS